MKNGIWVVLVMINVILGFEECPTLIMDDKVYDLGSMKSRDNIAYILNNAVIEISMCEPIDCG